MAKWNDIRPRPPWLARLPWRKRATWLIRDYLQHRIETMEHAETRSRYRRFLAKFDEATRGDNIAGVELDMLPTPDDPRAVLIYPMIPGVGCVTWLPYLRAEYTEKLADIARETNPFGGPKLHREPVSRRADDPPRKRKFPPPPETALVAGR